MHKNNKVYKNRDQKTKFVTYLTKSRMYIFRKAYDLINRNSLWCKMIKEGIDGKISKVLKSLYSDIKLCVRHMNSVSDLFASDIGLLQGEITAPILFSL